MTERPFPCHVKRCLAREQNSYIGIKALHSSKAECIALLAGSAGQTGILPCALKVVVSTFFARCNHLFVYSIHPACRGPPFSGFSPKNLRKR